MKINLPTKITIARIALIPVIIIFLFLTEVNEYMFIISLLAFIAASCTDFIDGRLARSRNEVTTLGKFLDPIADKLLVSITMIIFLPYSLFRFAFGSRVAEYFFIVFVIIIISREFIISVFRQIAASKGIIMQADKLGKVKTFITCIAIGFTYGIFFARFNPKFGQAMAIIAYILWVVSVILTIVSAVNYIVINKRVLSESSAVNSVSRETSMEDEVVHDVDVEVVKADSEDKKDEK